MNKLSDFIVPAMLFGIIGVSLARGKSPFSSFTVGAKAALKDVYAVFPSLLALVVMTELLTASGVLDLFSSIMTPLLNFFKIPPELGQLFVIRPVSGSGATAVLQKILAENPPESLISKCACVICAGTETTLYVCAVYFGRTHIKKLRHCLICALFGDIVCVITACFFCGLFL